MESLKTFEVLDPGILTTIQDLGRYGFSQFGVPPSGSLDPFSLRIGNLLVGNREEEASLETTLPGLKLRAVREVVVAVTGGDLCPVLNGESFEMWRTHLLVEGDVLSFKKIQNGCRAYVAVGGGIAVASVMGSKSTCLSGGFGGLDGRALQRGDILHVPDVPVRMDKLGVRFPTESIPLYSRESILHVIPGPQDQHFTGAGFETFYFGAYRVTPQSNRTGIRLEGARIERRAEVEASIISEPLLPGAIQVPGDGKPIIVLTELVTGGYTKIATVISTDLPKVGQLKPGDQVDFTPVSLETAHHSLRKQEEQIERFRDGLLRR